MDDHKITPDNFVTFLHDQRIPLNTHGTFFKYREPSLDERVIIRMLAELSEMTGFLQLEKNRGTISE